ncbi:hypothetical protein CMQ_6598 [Grosmannia clavigera kw1407]|uniref:Uncharacterized protein n=1 Tax=Grosmannia clavigera (strain kw1407 / UAMH 11150) TaxID=655863 RepID=F0X7B8_GROCL|nr:uncharacterized protein CMQ_6598 [Grosmannia clavigera kw1407]EFX06277.1 hypothetical protein CMQ_6598 [Grosmannia clavigera kw1407]
MASRKETRSDETESSGTTEASQSTNVTSPMARNEADNENILPLLTPPSEEEAVNYYHGILSEPRLVGRASAGIEIWETCKQVMDRLPPEPFMYYPRKQLDSIGNHPIRKCWRAVQPLVVEAISGLPWTSIDIFRIGYQDSQPAERPVVVWVGVETASIPWYKVAEALRSCRKALDSANLNLANVDCQIRVSTVMSLAGPSLLPPYRESPTDETVCVTAQPFTTTIGQSIFPFSNPGLRGTLGIYVSPARTTKSPVWALTCRHVGIPNDTNPDNKLYHRRNSSQKALRIGLPAEKTMNESMVEIQYMKDDWTRRANNVDDAFTRQQLEVVNRLHGTIKSFEPLENREFGSLLYSPPVGRGQYTGNSGDSQPWTRDWSLVDLDVKKFPGDIPPTNMVDLRTRAMTRNEVNLLLNPHVMNKHKFTFPNNGLLKISGIISLKEMFKPVTRDAEGEKGFLVGKRGAVTGLTWGKASELESTVRKCLPSGGSFESFEWAIHGSLEDHHRAFSKKGDSGAAVFGIDGRLGGLLTTGTGEEESQKIDISYVTPIEPLLLDIEKEMGHDSGIMAEIDDKTLLHITITNLSVPVTPLNTLTCPTTDSEKEMKAMLDIVSDLLGQGHADRRLGDSSKKKLTLIDYAVAAGYRRLTNLLKDPIPTKPRRASTKEADKAKAPSKGKATDNAKVSDDAKVSDKKVHRGTRA